MLREVGKRDQQREEAFLQAHHELMAGDLLGDDFNCLPCKDYSSGFISLVLTTLVTVGKASRYKVTAAAMAIRRTLIQKFSIKNATETGKDIQIIPIAIIFALKGMPPCFR